MSVDELSSSAETTGRLLRRLFKGLERRAAIDGAARSETDVQLLETVAELAQLTRQPLVEVLDGPPARGVGLAMATALYGQPHLALFADLPSEGTDGVKGPSCAEAETPLVPGAEILRDALGIPEWELEDIREEVDRRVGTGLKQSRALWWMWSHFDLKRNGADAIFRVLFPGIPEEREAHGFYARGTQLYTVVEQEVSPPTDALFLSWLPIDESKSLHPVRTFRARYVTPSLRRALARGIGASSDEVVEILDRMNVLVPKATTEAFLAHDEWRASGLSAITDMPSPRGEPVWLVRPLEPEDVPFTSWLRADIEAVDRQTAKAAFDALAIPRVDEMLRQLYVAMLSRLRRESTTTAGTPMVDDLLLFDVERHLRAVLSPILAWIESPRTMGSIAGQLGLPSERVRRLLDGVAGHWKSHVDSAWIGRPKEGQARSVQVLLALHLIATHDSLRAILRRRPDPRSPHRDVAILFAAQYFCTAPLERLLSETQERSGSSRLKGLDVIGQWFWGTWQRVLDILEDEVTEEERRPDA